MDAAGSAQSAVVSAVNMCISLDFMRFVYYDVGVKRCFDPYDTGKRIFYSESPVAKHSGQTACRLARLCFSDANLYEQVGR